MDAGECCSENSEFGIALNILSIAVQATYYSRLCLIGIRLIGTMRLREKAQFVQVSTTG